MLIYMFISEPLHYSYYHRNDATDRWLGWAVSSLHPLLNMYTVTLYCTVYSLYSLSLSSQHLSSPDIVNVTMRLEGAASVLLFPLLWSLCDAGSYLIWLPLSSK